MAKIFGSALLQPVHSVCVSLSPFSLYNSETWTIKEENKWKLRVFEMAMLLRIYGLTRHDRIRNMDVKKDLNIKNDITAVLQQ